MSHENITMTNISRHLKWLLVISNLIAPYGLFLAISITGKNSQVGALYSFSAALLILLTATYLFTRFHQAKYLYITGLIGLVVAELIWLQFEHFQMMMGVFVFLLFSVLFRLQMVISSKELAFHIGKELRIDSLLLVLTIVVLLFAQSGAKAPNYGVMNLYIALLCMLAIVLRLLGMMILAREESETQGASKFIPILLIGVLVCLIAAFGKYLILVALVAFILLMIPFIPAVRKTLYVIGGMIAVAFVVLLVATQVTVRKGQQIPFFQKPVHQTVNEMTVDMNGSLIRFYLALTVLGILLAWGIWRRYLQKQKSEDILQDQVEIVNRGWIRHNRNKKGLRFLPTQHPVRLAYQKWLKDLFKKGFAIQAFETPSQFYLRVSESTAKTGEDLTNQYQEARYNMRTDHNEL